MSIIDFFIGSEKYIQPFTSLHQVPNFNPGRDMNFKSSDRGCRTKGPLPNLGRLTVHATTMTVERRAVV